MQKGTKAKAARPRALHAPSLEFSPAFMGAILLRLLFFFFLYSICLTKASTVSVSHGNKTDLAPAALLAFKNRIDSKSGALNSWNGTRHFCMWEGVKCSRRHPMRVLALELPARGLAGTISPSIGNLTFLRRIALNGNKLFGEIPSTLGRLRRLRYLNLTDNLIRGVIPPNLSYCSQLTYIGLSDNQLHGRIPQEIGSLSKLQALFLGNNSFTGVIPHSLGNLSLLNGLSLWGNNLVGSIPDGLGRLTNLGFLHLPVNNLTGTVPPSLYNLSSLYYISLAVNQLGGSLPDNIGNNLPILQYLLLGENRLTGTIPGSVSNISQLEMFELASNNFSGRIPPEIGRLQALGSLNLAANQLEASGSEDWEFLEYLTNCSSLQELALDANRFGGELPAAVANLSTQLRVLGLDHNYISGYIPPGIEKLVDLQSLDLSSNFLTGIIPQGIGKLSKLQLLYLPANNLTGTIPSSLGNLTQLNVLNVAFNNLQGPIPAALGNLQQLTILDLSSNDLSSSIPREIFVLSSLSQYLSLSYNSLVGSLPSEVGALTNLRSLEVSGNRLSGDIPNTLGNCQVMEYLLIDKNFFHGNIPQSVGNMKGLQALNLTQNNLSGPIPDALGSIYGLQELYLSRNNLSGPIPKVLENLTYLFKLDLSFNHLEGEVPKEGVFKNVTALSMVGNGGLCGGILQLHLPPCPTPIRSSNKKGLQRYVRIVIPTAGATLFFILSWVAALLIYRKLKLRKKDASSTQAIEDQYPKVSYGELFIATDGFSQTNLIGKGRYGCVYKGTLSYDQSAPVAVKVFNLQQSGSSKSFIAECEALRRVRHRSLIKIVTCCSSVDYQGNEFKALIFEFMPNNSLESWLHPKVEDSQQRKALSLPERLNIAVDVADALDYLHHSCQPAIIHCDMKPSNILLDQDMSAHIGDFGLARLLPEVVSMSLVNSRSSVGIKGSIGYIAPEYGEASQLSTCGDVYSFGITLLQMFTGRSPVDEMFKDGLNLHEFAAAAFPERVTEIADPIVLLHAEDDVAAVESQSGGNTSRRIAEACLVSVMKVGLLCSKQSPSARISMRDAAKEMHTIRDMYLGVGNHERSPSEL